MRIEPLSRAAQRIEYKPKTSRYCPPKPLHIEEFKDTLKGLYFFTRITDQHWRGVDENPVEGEVTIKDFEPRWGAPDLPDKSETFSAELDKDGYLEIKTSNGGRILAYETTGKFIARADLRQSHTGNDNDSSQYIEVYPDKIVYMSEGIETLEPGLRGGA